MIYVTNWKKWTSAKKKLMGICYLFGFPMAVTLDETFAPLGFLLLIIASYLVHTIRYDEW